MKKLFFIAVLITGLVSLTFVGCEKESASPTTEASFRKGGNGKGPNSGGTVGYDTAATDSFFNACGIVRADTGWRYPTVQLNNLRWRKVTGYSYDPATNANTYPYDILVIEFDAPVIPNKTVTCYLLKADQCQGRPVCFKENGIALSQVTTCNTTTRFWLPIGTSWLNPNVVAYTGVIVVGTSDGCLYHSQPFTFEPPKILSL